MRMNTYLFEDRRDAGRKLGERIAELSLEDPLILALPRGGVPVGFEIARAIGAPLDVLVVRKLGVPGHSELAMGAIASGGARVLNDSLIASLRISPGTIEAVAEEERKELERRERVFRGERAPAEVRGREVLLVDDGLATGATMRVAVESLRVRGPERLIAAVPVGAPDSCEMLEAHVDELICLERPSPFHGVGLWYRVFDQTSDEEVRELLAAESQEARRAHA